MNVEINKENFKRLLKWLDSDEEQAAERYGHIYRVLIKYFYSAGCPNSEELADETIDRMIGQIKKLKNYEGEKIKYFLGIARNIKMESFRKRENQTELYELDNLSQQAQQLENPTDENLSEIQMNCLKICLQKLSAKERKLILEYHNVTNSNKKKDVHKKLAENFSLTANALRVQIFSLKQRVAECAGNCAEKGAPM